MFVIFIALFVAALIICFFGFKKFMLVLLIFTILVGLFVGVFYMSIQGFLS